jgi:predicted metal-binding protein
MNSINATPYSAAPASLFVCSLCQFSQDEPSRDGKSGGEYLIEQLQTELQARNLQDAVHLTPLRCMAGCSQACNVSLAAPNKLTFILSHLSPTAAAAAVSDFCQQYSASADGRVPYRERPATVRQATAFVLPPLPAPSAGS